MARLFFYVAPNGVRTSGGLSSAETGTFASISTANKFATRVAAYGASTPPVAGDIVIVDTALNEAVTGDTTVNVPDGVADVTADTSDCTSYLKASSPQTSPDNGESYSLKAADDAEKQVSIWGANISSRDLTKVGAAGSSTFIVDTKIEHTWATTEYNALNVTTGGGQTITLDSDLLCQTGVNQRWQIGYAHSALLLGGTVKGGTTTTFDIQSRGASVVCMGVDFSGSPTASDIANFSASSDYSGIYYFLRCKEFTSLSFEEPGSICEYVIFESCSSEIDYRFHAYNGVIETTTATYHNDDDEIQQSATNFSYEFVCENTVSATDTSYLVPYAPIGSRWLGGYNDNASTNGKVRIKFATASGKTLDTKNVLVIVLYPDSTNTYLYKTARAAVSPLESGSALSTQTSKWTQAASEASVQYYLDVTMSSPGDGFVQVMVGFQWEGADSGTEIYLSPMIEFVP